MRCVATRLGLQTGQARLGAVRGKPVWEPEFLATRLGLQTGQARLGARVPSGNTGDSPRVFSTGPENNHSPDLVQLSTI